MPAYAFASTASHDATLDKPLPDLPVGKRSSKHLFSTLCRLPQALKAKRQEGCTLQRRPAIRIKPQRRETFVMQAPHHTSQALPDPAYLGNRLLLAEKDRRSLARSSAFAHIHPLAPISEQYSYTEYLRDGSASNRVSTPPSLDDNSDSSSPSILDFDPTASPRSYFSDDSPSDSEGAFSIYEYASESDCDDFPLDEEAFDADDEDLTSDLDVQSFVDKLEDDRRWSSLFDERLSSVCSSPSPSSSSSPCLSPPELRSLAPSPLPHLDVAPYLPSAATARHAFYLPAEHDFPLFSSPAFSPPRMSTPPPPPAAAAPITLDHFDFTLTSEPPSPTGRRFRRGSLPLPPPSPTRRPRRNDERRGSTKTL
ncbi:hypothetical protein JCM10207_001777 [Rhodosporidiobolus poonsookiae]